VCVNKHILVSLELPIFVSIRGSATHFFAEHKVSITHCLNGLK